ncbi:hypothetical protein BDR06DRAFT_1015431 [Suillus hirtellus]|nr:hypothetical protein BDR06DRAFT_1015431 [Suillus hirtellus]
MSSSEYANKALNLVTDKIQWIIKKSEKLPMGDLAAKTLTHKIAVTLHGHAATSVPPMLLSCTAELQYKSAPNGKLKGLPDWAMISDNDSHITSHPLFKKTIGYTCPIPAALPQPVTTPLPTHPALAPQPSNPACAVVASALFPITTPALPPPNPMSKPFNLLVQSNKRKALTSKLDNDDEEPVLRPAKGPVSKSC